MILANGLIRTLDPQVPTQRAIAIAGELIAGGVGVHETALASPDVTDLGGLVVVPGFTDSHVHFPTWALAQNEVNLDGCTTLDEALQRIRGVEVQPGRWLRGYGWRSGDWQPQRDPTRHDLDAITAEVPAGLIAKDYHSLWLNSAALELAQRRPRGRRRRRRARRARRADGNPARRSRLALQGAAHDRPGRRLSRRYACRRAPRELARRHRRARQGRLARGTATVAAARRARPADSARVAVDPPRQHSTQQSPSACAPGSAVQR